MHTHIMLYTYTVFIYIHLFYTQTIILFVTNGKRCTFFAPLPGKKNLFSQLFYAFLKSDWTTPLNAF